MDAFLRFKILSKDLTELYLRPYIKAESEGENLFYGHGIWMYKEEGKPIKEYLTECDAGVSFKSAIIRKDEMIYTVISNTGDGTWPIVREIRRFL